MNQHATTYVESALGFVLPSDWSAKESDRHFTSDEVISAYIAGKNHATAEAINEIKREFSSNVALATRIAEALLKSLVDKNIVIKGAHLKPHSVSYFEFLIVFDHEFYETDEFYATYFLSREIKSRYALNNLSVEFTFMSDEGDISNDCLISDGYFLSYDQGEEN
mgnify:CR=1 FL=1